MTKIFTLIQFNSGSSAYLDRCGHFKKGEQAMINFEYLYDIQKAGEALGVARINNSDGENILLINGWSEDNYKILDDDVLKKELENNFFDLDNIAFDYYIKNKK